MRKLIMATILIFSSSQIFSNESENYGQLTPKHQLDAHEERIHSLVAGSYELRKTIQQQMGRNIAGTSPADEKFHKEFEDLLNENNNSDYLEMASRL